MVDAALRKRLDEIVVLLVMTVALLSGLVFGRDYGGEAFLAVLSAVVVGILVLVVRVGRSG